MAHVERAVGPPQVVDEAPRQTVRRLLEVDRERDVVAKVVRRAERDEQSMERDGPIVRDDRNVNSRSVPIYERE